MYFSRVAPAIGCSPFSHLSHPDPNPNPNPNPDLGVKMY